MGAGVARQRKMRRRKLILWKPRPGKFDDAVNAAYLVYFAAARASDPAAEAAGSGPG